ncbi:N-acetyltransferase [uncultured Oxalicibacterium sp.]|uniref:N-acetyltransferase n=1 Tax=uncultured Oxalicibacterium sp. TaxID=1168540 RepID=UPI0025F113D9|nr:N-acetyltransferase [uncultured Oxalicibacterium sp.]
MPEPAGQLGKSLRIDVELPPAEVERDLAALHQRMRRHGDALHDLPVLPIHYPHLRFRYREADGEHYIYVEDVERDCLAGVTVFNRLIELNRLQDRHLRATHSRYASAYQRRGIATLIYRWWLDQGHCLLSGARQSLAAHALWQKLATSYQLHYVDLRDKQLTLLGENIDQARRNDLHTRLLLLGRGLDLCTFADLVRIKVDEDARLIQNNRTA